MVSGPVALVSILVLSQALGSSGAQTSIGWGVGSRSGIGRDV